MSKIELPNPVWIAPDDAQGRIATYLVDGYALASVIRVAPRTYFVSVLGRNYGTVPTMDEARRLAIATLKNALTGITEALAFLLAPAQPTMKG